MARAKTQDVDEDVETAADNGDAKAAVRRVSITVDPELRKQMRIAAAINDMDIGEWAVKVLTRAVERATEEA